MRFYFSILRVLRRCCSGSSRADKGAMMVEAAIALPFLCAALLGTTEMARYINIHQKMERTAITMADLVSRSSSLTTAQINDIFLATEQMMSPYGTGTSSRVTISSVSKATGQAARVTWQRSGGGTLAATSRIGTVNGNATFPAGFTLRDGESVIVAEIWATYKPVLGEDIFVTELLYERALFRPRLSSSVTVSN